MVYKVDNFGNSWDDGFAMATTIAKKMNRMDLLSREKQVVNELTQAIRKFQDQAPLALVRLLGIAFESTHGAGVSREDKLARAHVRGLGVRQQLVEAEGGSWSSEEVARRLDISKTAVLKRLAAIDVVSAKRYVSSLPAGFFDRHPARLPEEAA